MALADIPKPAGALPGIGHLRLISADAPVHSLVTIARQHGEIFALDFPGGEVVFVSSQRLVHELCDESRFDKKVTGALRNIRDIARDGLFTAHTVEPNWQKAHNILLPAFSMGSMANYYPMMLEIAQQLIGRWRARNPSDVIDVPDDMVRLTLDTIGLCGFDYRFNSFAQTELHPFVDSMLVALQEALDRAVELPLVTRLHWQRKNRYERHVANLIGVVDQVIAERRRQPAAPDSRDLLGLMLEGKDPATGEPLSDENIRYQIITFLIAGHETTSGLLSFTLYLLLKHPAVLRRAVAEVDRVLGPDTERAPTLAEIGRLGYLRQILSEALRLYPPAPAFTLMPKADTLLDGRYALRAGQPLMVLVSALHRDPAVWGDNPELFDPERFSVERSRERAPDAFKPFGNGQRACIGSQFALQEATLALGLILQNFRLIDVDNYQLHIKESLTFKPEGFRLQVRPRTDSDRQPEPVPAETMEAAPAAPVAALDSSHGTPLLVLYGSNMGTAEQIARRLAEEGARQGFKPSVAALDERSGDLPLEGVVLLVSASYNGQPPDNAVRFLDWLGTPGLRLDGVRYAVFGVGNRDWATTYQRVPELLDERLAQAGAERLLPRGEADARGDFFGDVDGYLERLWPQLGLQLGLTMSIPGGRRPVALEWLGDLRTRIAETRDLQFMRVLENRELVVASEAYGAAKRHLEIALPEGVVYQTGDHYLVMPDNPEPLVQAALARFELKSSDRLRLDWPERRALFPESLPVTVEELLRYGLELQLPASQRQVRMLIAVTDCPPERARLEALVASPEHFHRDVLAPRRSLLQLLLETPSAALRFEEFLTELPELQPRYYSISSASNVEPARVALTVSVVDEPAWSGSGRHLGAASNTLANAEPGQDILGRVRRVESNFLLPETPEQPLIMISAGTGVAPFRGFVRHRAELARTGVQLGPAWLFFGCRHPQVDSLYQAEFQAAEAAGQLRVEMAFSRHPDADFRYVQHALAGRAAEVWDWYERGAIFYVCGDAQGMLQGVKEALQAMYQEARPGGGSVAGAQWLLELEQSGRLRVDAWS